MTNTLSEPNFARHRAGHEQASPGGVENALKAIELCGARQPAAALMAPLEQRRSVHSSETMPKSIGFNRAQAYSRREECPTVA